jgi:hypothetical protein
MTHLQAVEQQAILKAEGVQGLVGEAGLLQVMIENLNNNTFYDIPTSYPEY